MPALAENLEEVKGNIRPFVSPRGPPWGWIVRSRLGKLGRQRRMPAGSPQGGKRALFFRSRTGSHPCHAGAWRMGIEPKAERPFSPGLTAIALSPGSSAGLVFPLRFPSFESAPGFEVFLIFGATCGYLHCDRVAPMMTNRTLFSFNDLSRSSTSMRVCLNQCANLPGRRRGLSIALLNRSRKRFRPIRIPLAPCALSLDSNGYARQPLRQG